MHNLNSSSDRALKERFAEFGLTALALAIGVATFVFSGGSAQFHDALERGVLTTLLTFSFTTFWKVTGQQSDIEGKLDKLEETIGDWRKTTEPFRDRIQRTVARNTETIHDVGSTLKLVHGELKSYKMREAVSKQDEWVQTVLDRTISTHYSFIQLATNGAGFRVQTQQLAIEMYVNFWEELAAIQKHDDSSARVVRITHSSSPVIWEDRQIRRALAYQSAFIRSKGTIVRIFIDRGAEPTTETKAEMLAMEEMGMKVFYVQSENGDELRSDFLWLKPYALEWQANPNRSHLVSGSVSAVDDGERERFKREWLNLGSAVIKQSKNLDSALIDVLETFE